MASLNYLLLAFTMPMIEPVPMPNPDPESTPTDDVSSKVYFTNGGSGFLGAFSRYMVQTLKTADVMLNDSTLQFHNSDFETTQPISSLTA
jgi:hypothetical protein